MPDFSREERACDGGHHVVAGIDEAGRGPWAGPVVAAAVVFDRDRLPDDIASEIDDSKKLNETARLKLMHAFAPYAHVGIGLAEVMEIDTYNILQATFLAMTRAVGELPEVPSLALVDGNKVPALPCDAEAVIKGDTLSLSIAAASIVAKVTRDGIMQDLAERFPGYGWERNAGYGTKDHRAALEALGVTPVHRRSYRPVVNILTQNAAATQHIETSLSA